MDDRIKVPPAELELRNYLGHLPMPCSYLPGRDARLLFLRGAGIGAGYRALLELGYRRHGSELYRPDCLECSECQVLRVPVQSFCPTRSQRRILRKGNDRFRIAVEPATHSSQKRDLYRKYLSAQHGRSDPEDGSAESYSEFFTSSIAGIQTREVQLLDGRRLVGVGIVDWMEDVLSSVYFYFDPDYASYSPGTYSMLREIQLAADLGLQWYYPGFYIAGCAAMNYKGRFGPNQLRRLPDGPWLPGPAGHRSPQKSPGQGEKSSPVA